MCSPCKFQLSKADVACRVVVTSRAELYVLRFIDIPKSWFSRLVEATCYVLDVFLEGRILEKP